MPGFIEYCHPTLRETAPDGAAWVHEIKSDGYRAQAHLRDGNVIIYSRRGYNWTAQFSPIADGLIQVLDVSDGCRRLSPIGSGFDHFRSGANMQRAALETGFMSTRPNQSPRLR
jgi:hypothetical protein